MVMGYQAYAGNGLLDGIQTGAGLRKAYDDMQRQRGLAEGMEKIANGDESGWADVAKNAPDLYMRQQQWKAGNELSQKQFNALQNENAWKRQYQQEMLGLERQKIAQQQNGGAWTTDLGRMWSIANDPNQTPENRQMATQYLQYTARNPLANQGWNYAGRIGTLQADLGLGGQVEEEKTLGRERAQEQVKRETAAKDASNRVARIDSLIDRSQKHKDLLQPYSAAQAELGKWTSYGMSDEDRITRGELIRDVSDVKNDLIARARQNGQTGINTAREIELATKGIESSDWATLVGGLKALKNYEKVVSALEDGQNVSPQMSMTGGDEVIDYTTWLNGDK